MVKLMRNRIALAKIESVYGTDPTPTGSANAILIRNDPVLTPLASDEVSRNLIRGYMGGSDRLIANQHVMIEFEVEMQGSGALGTAPAYGPLIRACAMSETVTASTKVEYLSISSALESLTMYFNVDGVLHKFKGCRGTYDISIVAGQIPFYKFTMMGIYVAPTDTALPTPVYTGFKDPLVVNNTNTGAFSFFGVSGLILRSLEIQAQNALTFRNLIGTEYAQITDRDIAGTLLFEAPALATFNVFSTALGTAKGALSITHGTADGYKVKLDAPAVDIGQPTYADEDGVVMISCPIFINPSSGNDDLKITII